MKDKKLLSPKLLVCLALNVIAAGCILFGKWVELDFYFTATSFSLVKIYKSFSTLRGEIDWVFEYAPEMKTAFTLLIVVLYGVLALGIVTLYKTLRDGWYGIIRGWFFNYSIALSLGVLLVLLALNLLLEEEFEISYWIFQLMPGLYGALATGLAGTLVIRKMPENPISIDSGSAVLDKAKQTAQDAKQAVARAMQARGTVCPKCGEVSPDAASQFCTHCGARLHVELHCKNCGKTLRGDMKFCPACGASVKEPDKGV